MAKTLAQATALSASGLWGSSVAAVVAAVEKTLNRPLLVVCGHLDEADDLADDIYLFSGQRPEVLPALELGGSLGHISEELVSNRLGLLSRMSAEGGMPRFLVASIQSLMQPVPSRKQLEQLLFTIKPGQKLEAEKLIVWLADHGYNRLEQVEVPGDFAVRGGIIDVYIPGEFEVSGEEVGLAARIDFFDDQIESIKRFDLDSMGSLQTLESVRLVDLKGAASRQRRLNKSLSLPPARYDRRPLGAAGNRRAGQKLSGPSQRCEGDVSAQRPCSNSRKASPGLS